MKDGETNVDRDWGATAEHGEEERKTLEASEEQRDEEGRAHAESARWTGRADRAKGEGGRLSFTVIVRNMSCIDRSA